MNRNGTHCSSTFSIAITVCLAITTALSLRADVVTLYNVDFGSPPHTVGQAPLVDDGTVPRLGPSALTFTPPTVESSVGAMDDQPLQLRVPSGTLSIAEFDLGYETDIPTGFDLYRVELDAMVVSLDWQFDALELVFDLPLTRSVRLRGDQAITQFVPFSGGRTIGSYTFGTPVRLRVDLHVASERWAISVDGTRLYIGPGAVESVDAVRIALQESDPPYNSLAAVDNVRILGVDHALCPGDLDFDAAVTLQDLALLLAHFGTSGAWLDDGDTDSDGDVDLQDLASLLADFGRTCP